MRIRAAPTESALASGPRACAVPVVPKHTAASSTASTNRMAYCYTICARCRSRVGSRMSRAMRCDDAAATRHPTGDPNRRSRRDIRRPGTEDSCARRALQRLRRAAPNSRTCPSPSARRAAPSSGCARPGVCRSDWHAWMGHDDTVVAAARARSRVRRRDRRARRRGRHRRGLGGRRPRHRPVHLRLRTLRRVPLGQRAGLRRPVAAGLHALGLVRRVRRDRRGRAQPHPPARLARLRRGRLARLPVRDRLPRDRVAQPARPGRADRGARMRRRRPLGDHDRRRGRA